MKICKQCQSQRIVYQKTEMIGVTKEYDVDFNNNKINIDSCRVISTTVCDIMRYFVCQKCGYKESYKVK